jgi:glycosyltransferase involved in cell wall biosynthesis
MQDYVREYAALHAELLYLPVYGTGPFPNLARHDRGFVTMINPCALKGISIFLALARACPHIEFAAVPTWGSDQSVLREIASTPNVTVLEPSDDIEDILRQTRILLAPSLWPETFGYVVPEAMVRGIPVLASRLGGLVEAKLGVGYLLPVAPAERRGGSYAFPTQDVAPWLAALQQLLNDPDAYRSCSAASRDAALQFVSQARVGNFERLLTSLAAAPT